MAKIFNRALLIAGEKKKVGTPIVTIVTLDGANKVTRCFGSSVPTNGDAGYAVGCFFAQTTGTTGATVYINEGSATSCTFNALTSGASGGISTWNQLYANGATLAVTGSTVTFDGQHATNNVFTVSDTSAGSGNLIQITNTGSGSDINGTSSTWGFSKLGAMTGLSIVLAGTAATTSFTMTLGNMVLSAGGIAITKATDTATFTITNNSVATTVASTWTLNGLTSGGGKLITSSGTITTTGYLMTLTANSATTAAGLFRMNANGLTSGIAQVITSSATAITGAGRLLRVDHTGSTTSTGILSEFASAAADATVILKVTASAALLSGGALIQASAASMTTGTVLDIPDMAVLTTGIGISVVSSATAITGAGRLFFSNHTGATGTSAILNEFKSAATDETIVTQVTTAAMINGVALKVVGTTGMTTGSLLLVTSSTAAAVATNGIISLTATGAFTSTSSTNGGFVEIKANSTTAGTIVNVVGTALTTGVGLILSNGTSAMTTGSLLAINASGVGTIATNGIVSIRHAGICVSTSNAGVLDVQSATMVGTASNATLVNFKLTGAAQVNTTVLNVENAGFTTGFTGSMLRVTSPTTTGTGILVDITAPGLLSGGKALSVATAVLTTGTNTSITGTGAAITTGSLLLVSTDSTAAVATNGVISFTSTGAFTSNSAIDGGFVEIKANSTTAGTILNLVGSALTTGVALNISNGTAATTTGSLLRVAAGGTGAVATNGIVSFTHTGVYTSNSVIDGGFVEVKANSTTAGTIVNIVGSGLITGVALSISNGTAATTSGSLIRAVAGGTGAVATNGIFAFRHTGVYTSTAATIGMFHVSASATTAGTVASISGLAVVGGNILNLDATAATLTTGRYLSANDAAGEVFGIGANGHIHSTVGATAPTIAVGVQAGITAAAITAGGSDTCGVITTTGTSTGATQITVTFNKTYTTAPKTVILTPANASAAMPNTSYLVDTITATTFRITVAAGGTYAATPSWYYFVIA